MVAVAKLDRLSRDMHFISGLIAHRAPFVVVAELGTDLDPFVLHLFAALAEKERKMISDRSRADLVATRKRGAQLGNPKLRDRKQAKLVGRAAVAALKVDANRHAAMVRDEIENFRNITASTLREIAEALNRRGIPTHRGKKWCATLIKNVIARSTP